MSIVEKLRLSYPLPLAKLYMAVQFETDPRLQVQKLIELFEGLVRYLALIGMAEYVQDQLADPKVEQLRENLDRPSLGHWVNLLQRLSICLEPRGFQILGESCDRNRSSDSVGDATRQLTKILDASSKSGKKLEHFLNAVVQFRNKKFGHGSLTKPQAKEVLRPLEDALLTWLDELTVLQHNKLVYLAHVELHEPVTFRYRGYNLNAGDSPVAFSLDGVRPLPGNRPYLFNSVNGEFLPLYPFFFFDDDVRLLFIFSDISNRGKPILRCPYEVPGGEFSRELDVNKTIIVGVGGSANLAGDISTQEPVQATIDESSSSLPQDTDAVSTSAISFIQSTETWSPTNDTVQLLAETMAEVRGAEIAPDVELGLTNTLDELTPADISTHSTGDHPDDIALGTSSVVSGERLQIEPELSDAENVVVSRETLSQLEQVTASSAASVAATTFDELVKQLEFRARATCCSQARYPVLWVVGEPLSGKTTLARAVSRRTGWRYTNFTLDPGCLDDLIGQEETYRAENFLAKLRHLCMSSADVLILDEIEPLLGWWTWDEQEVFFRTIARATRLQCGVVLITRMRNAQQLERLIPGKNHVFEIPKGAQI